MEKQKNFWDKNAGRYDRFMRKDAAAYERLYELLRASMIVYQLNGEPLSASVGGTNQLWLGSTSARYFASDVVEVRVTCEDEVPAIPGSPASGDHASNVPNVGVTAGVSA